MTAKDLSNKLREIANRLDQYPDDEGCLYMEHYSSSVNGIKPRTLKLSININDREKSYYFDDTSINIDCF